MEAVLFTLQITIVGMGIVFIALWLLIGLLALMQRIDRRMARPAPAAVPAPAPAVAPGTELLSNGLSPELMAAISAAVTVATARRVRVTRMRYLGTPPEGTWSRQGRLTIMASHRPKG